MEAAAFLWIVSALLLTTTTFAYVYPKEPTDCFTHLNSTDLDGLLDCFGFNFIADKDKRPWSMEIATEEQHRDLRDLVSAMLFSSDHDTTSCLDVEIPASLRDFYRIQKFTSNRSAQSFCVLYEYSWDWYGLKRFKKGWPAFVTPLDASSDPDRSNVHFSAAHPYFDGLVHRQAAAMLEMTKGRSATINLSRRNPVSCNPEGLEGEENKGVKLMFHSALIGTKNYQFHPSQKSKCISSKCAFIQFHGKSSDTCPDDTIFLATHSCQRCKQQVYNGSLPVDRLTMAFRRHALPEWRGTAKKYGDNTTRCDMTGNFNIFGKLINGVEEGRECDIFSTPEQTSGLWIHIEQAYGIVIPQSWDAWAKAIKDAFSGRS